MPPSAEGVSKQKIQRKVQADVTNDANGSKPDSDEAKAREEETLRCQVKTLLQKVETNLHRTQSLRTLSHINGFLSTPTRLGGSPPWKTPPTTFRSPFIARRFRYENEPLPVYSDPAIPSTATIAKPNQDNEPLLVTPTNVGLSSPAMLTPFSSLSDLAKSEREDQGRGFEEEDGLKHPIHDIENPVTRALLFDSPEKHSQVEITMSSISAADLSEVSPTVRGSPADESSDWSILVAFSPTVNASVRVGVSEESAASKTRPPQAKDISKSLECHPTSVDSCEQNDVIVNEARATNCPTNKYRSGGDANETDFEVDDSESFYDYAESAEEDDNYSEDDNYTALCTELEELTIGGNKGLPAFEGKRAYFIYNSDDEIDQELVLSTDRNTSPSILRLKGLPTPQGKHLRFPDDFYNSDDEIEQHLVLSTAQNTSPNVLHLKRLPIPKPKQPPPIVTHLRGLPKPNGKYQRFPDEDSE